MNMRAAVTIVDNELQQAVYEFIVLDGVRVEFDGYRLQERKTKRHKWCNVNVWSRLQRRDCTISRPAVPMNIIEAVLTDFRKRIYFQAEE